MRRSLLLAAVITSLWAGPRAMAGADWQGVDKTVVEKIAQDAGRPPTQPIINTDRGDLLLLVFLAAGAVGGFVAGYVFRGLFPPRKKASH